MNVKLITVFAGVLLAGVCGAAENPGWDYRVRNIYIPKGGYFATGFVPTGSPKATIRCSVYAEAAIDVFGTATRQAGCFILNLAPKQYYYRYGNANYDAAWGSYELKCPLDLVCDNKLACYGTTLGTVASPGSMAANTSEVTVPGKQYLGAMDLFSFKAEEGGTTKCDFIPCVKGGVAQLYDTVRGTFVTMSGTGTPAAGPRVADDGSDIDLRGIVTTLPEPTADGWYVFGNANYNKQDKYNSEFFQTMVYPKWSALNLPANAKVKLVGGIVLESGLPDSATLDLSEVKGIYQRDRYAFGPRAVTIPAGSYWFPSSCAVTETNSLLIIGKRSDMTVTNDFVINGTLRQSDYTCASLYFSGRITGTGRIESTNFGKHIHFNGTEFSFTGDNKFNSNYGGSINVTTRACQAKWKSFYINGTDSSWELKGYHGNRFVYNPPAGCNDPMSFTTLDGYAHVIWADGTRLRTGGAICCWGGRVIRADKLSGSLHFIADTKHNSTARDASATGYGNLEVGTMNNSTAYLSTNFNAVVATASGTASFNYTGDSNAVNTATLRVTNSCASTVTVKATDVVALPSVMKGLDAASKIYLVETIENETHAMPLDFAAAVANPAGCDGSGTLQQAPSAATIAVTFPTGRDAPEPASGRVPLATFDAGGERLANWTVTLNGSSAGTALCRGKSLTVVKDSTGLWIRVRKIGSTVVVR